MNGRRVLIRHRDSNGNRVETFVSKHYPFAYLRKEDAQFLPAMAKEEGHVGVFGEELTKVVLSDPYEVGELKSRFEQTWEANIPWVNRALSEHVKAGEPPIPNYEHRVWYLDMEWTTDSEAITIISVFDSFKKKMWTWAVAPPDQFPSRGQSPCLYVGKEHPYLGEGDEIHLQTPIQYFISERQMLQHFTEHMRDCDPDIITGWNVVNADCRVLIERCQKNGIDPKRMCGGSSKSIRHNFGDWAQPIGGRLVIDLMLAVCNLWQLKNGALPNKKLDTVAMELLGEQKLPLSNGHDTYYSDFQTYIDYNIQDVRLLPMLDEKMNALNHYLAIQHIVQCDIMTTPFVTRLFTVMAINDKEFDYRIPSRPMFAHEEYSGADIMEPSPGVYQGVAIMDIKAMYHSNVNLHNISWETLDEDGKDCGNGSHFRHGKRGLLGRQMDRMTQLRNEYKVLMKSAKTDSERARYDSMQYATKSLVASMYGAAGDSKYGLYHPEVASAITFTSRQTLFRLRDECNDRGMEVIYGHTDSVFVLCETPELGQKHIASINKTMSPIETEFEKWCSAMLISAKNRYAGMTEWTDNEYHDQKLYVKGIELKQNRLPKVMKTVMSRVIHSLLTNKPEDVTTEWLGDKIKAVIGGNVDDKDLCIRARLKQNLEDYSVLGEARAGAAWANRVLGKGYSKGSDFLSTIDSNGDYIAFDDPSEIEGISTIGYKQLAEKFLVDKVTPYYHIAGWDAQPLINALNGLSDMEWL